MFLKKTIRKFAAGTDFAKDRDILQYRFMKKIFATVFAAMLFEQFAGLELFAQNQTGITSSRLQWQWPYSTNHIVFNVHAQTNFAVPSGAWPVIGTTTATSFSISENLPAQFFFVLASNTVTGAVSPWP